MTPHKNNNVTVWNRMAEIGFVLDFQPDPIGDALADAYEKFLRGDLLVVRDTPEGKLVETWHRN